MEEKEETREMGYPKSDVPCFLHDFDVHCVLQPVVAAGGHAEFHLVPKLEGFGGPVEIHHLWFLR